MAFKFFTIAARDEGTVEAELNSFLSSHRVLSVDRRWVDQGHDSFWAICIDYLDGTSPLSTRGSTKPRGKDYKEILSPEDFSQFAVLRELRKELAQLEGVPVYTIFTNEQLAQIVQNRAHTKAELKEISGVGEARIEKYGDQFLEKLSAQTNGENDEASG